jgi:hypothetical protein
VHLNPADLATEVALTTRFAWYDRRFLKPSVTIIFARALNLFDAPLTSSHHPSPLQETKDLMLHGIISASKI